ncbi:anthrone oxygenase family protein [Streptomyces monashensis]|uniref:anthrone oxygenase family protein n=1 Tax=Streptomyces monashensis TaxID=1678012 RepID=UPI0033FB0815
MTNTGNERRGGTAVLVAAAITMGLSAGVFYIFACAVMPALARSDDRTYVAVMRNINTVIQNPVFFLCFMGAPVLTALAGWRLRGSAGARWVWAALLSYALVLLITMAFSIPLNNALAQAGAPASLREHFEGPWVAWNVVRAVGSTVALGCLCRALLVYGRPGRSRQPTTSHAHTSSTANSHS